MLNKTGCGIAARAIDESGHPYYECVWSCDFRVRIPVEIAAEELEDLPWRVFAGAKLRAWARAGLDAERMHDLYHEPTPLPDPVTRLLREAGAL